MRLVFLLLADYANITADNKLNVVGVFTHINARRFPARHPSMFLVSKLESDFGDADQLVELAIKLEDSDGHEVNSMALPIEIKRNPDGTRVDANIIVQFTDTVLTRPGIFQISVYLKNESLGHVEFTSSQA